MAHWVGGHGTHVAGVLAEAAGWQVELHHFNVGTLGTTMPLIADSVLAGALREALDLGCRVINMSLGGPTALDLGLPALSLAIRAAAGEVGQEGAGRSDAVIVAAAGNEGTSQPMFPAASKGVIGVGAVDADDNRPGFSNYGPWVDCATSGVDIAGPYVRGLVDAHATVTPAPTFDGWATWTGTSFAAPRVAGLIASILAGGATDSAKVAGAMVLAAGTPLPAALQLGVRV
jgi:subtilisin family serine protease